MHRVRPLLVLLVLLVLAAVPVAAQATDSHAPRGARGDWLPSDEWAMSQWLPYDEATLDHLLHADRDELASWPNDQRTLGQLARRRGFRDSARSRGASSPPAPTIRAAPGGACSSGAHSTRSRRRISPATCCSTSTTRPRSGPRRARLRREPAPLPRAPRPRPVAAPHRRRRPPLREASARSLLGLFADRGRRAVRIGAMSARQARTLLDEQTGTVDAFMARPYRTTDQQRDYAALVCHLPAPH